MEETIAGVRALLLLLLPMCAGGGGGGVGGGGGGVVVVVVMVVESPANSPWWRERKRSLSNWERGFCLFTAPLRQAPGSRHVATDTVGRRKPAPVLQVDGWAPLLEKPSLLSPSRFNSPGWIVGTLQPTEQKSVVASQTRPRSEDKSRW